MSQFCVPHWEQLREAIKDRGLWELVADTPEEVQIKIMRQAEEGITIDTYEPLLQANILIHTEHAHRSAGMHLHRCPVCVLGSEVIDEAADTVLSQWRDLGVA